MIDLKGQVAVVTGASSGIGKAIALSLAAQGTKLILVGRELKKLEEVTERAKEAAEFAKRYRLDLMLEGEIDEFAAFLKQEVGRVDILVHSAGGISIGNLDRAPVEKMDWHYKINVRAPYVLTQLLLPMMRPCQGQIVFINSSVGLKARASVGQYAATKHALRGIADSLREEVNAEGIRVLSMFLGRTASPMQAGVYKAEGKAYFPEKLMQPEDIAMVVVNALQLPKTAEVTDIFVRPMKKT